MKALVSGSFDPVTVGHIDMIKRASAIFDHVDVVIFVNSEKHYYFPLEKRLSLLRAACDEITNVTVCSDNGLVVDYCKRNGISVIVRGVRDTTDMSYESSVAAINRSLDPSLDTIFFPAKAELAHISSTFARDLLKHQRSISGVIPEKSIPLI